MKIDPNIKSDEYTEGFDATKTSNKENKITSIFKLHNGQILKNKLSLLTDSMYEFVSEENDNNFKFICNKGGHVEIDREGNILNWLMNSDDSQYISIACISVVLEHKFAEFAKKIMNKTNSMLEGIGYC